MLNLIEVFELSSIGQPMTYDWSANQMESFNP